MPWHSLQNGALTQETPSGRPGRLTCFKPGNEENFVWRAVQLFDGQAENLDNHSLESRQCKGEFVRLQREEHQEQRDRIACKALIEVKVGRAACFFWKSWKREKPLIKHVVGITLAKCCLVVKWRFCKPSQRFVYKCMNIYIKKKTFSFVTEEVALQLVLKLVQLCATVWVSIWKTSTNTSCFCFLEIFFTLCLTTMCVFPPFFFVFVFFQDTITWTWQGPGA